MNKQKNHENSKLQLNWHPGLWGHSLMGWNSLGGPLVSRLGIPVFLAPPFFVGGRFAHVLSRPFVSWVLYHTYNNLLLSSGCINARKGGFERKNFGIRKVSKAERVIECFLFNIPTTINAKPVKKQESNKLSHRSINQPTNQPVHQGPSRQTILLLSYAFDLVHRPKGSLNVIPQMERQRTLWWHQIFLKVCQGYHSQERTPWDLHHRALRKWQINDLGWSKFICSVNAFRPNNIVTERGVPACFLWGFLPAPRLQYDALCC